MKQLTKEIYNDIEKHFNKAFAKEAIKMLLNYMMYKEKITCKEVIEILKEISEEE